jgi:hypothetical protein
MEVFSKHLFVIWYDFVIFFNRDLWFFEEWVWRTVARAAVGRLSGRERQLCLKMDLVVSQLAFNCFGCSY